MIRRKPKNIDVFMNALFLAQEHFKCKIEDCTYAVRLKKSLVLLIAGDILKKSKKRKFKIKKLGIKE